MNFQPKNNRLNHVTKVVHFLQSYLKKFYKEHEDEHLLTKHKIREMIVEKTRKKALVKAIENNYDLAVLDDGLQDASFYKDLK